MDSPTELHSPAGQVEKMGNIEEREEGRGKWNKRHHKDSRKDKNCSFNTSERLELL